MSRLAQSETKKNHTPSKSSTSRALLQYKNGFFQGYIDQYNQRQGRGVYFWNTGEIYYGDWNQDHMEGEGIFYFALGGYVYGTFLDDRVHGYAVLCFSNGDYTAGFWERGVLNGKVVQHSNVDNDWCLEDYKNGICVRVLMKGKGLPPFENFSMIETCSLKKLLEKGSGLFVGGKEGNEKNSRAHLDFLAIDPDGWYHGNIQDHEPHGLGIVCYSEHKSDRGLFKDGALNGLGRSFFSNGDVYDGFYKKGKFHGIGVYFKSETEQYLYGMYESNECVQALTLGNGYPHELMKTIKTDFHLESAEFIDKETETEVLTLSCDDQNPLQEQEENSIEYEEAAKYHAADKKALEKRAQQHQKSQNTERDNDSDSYVHESESSEPNQRRAVEYEKMRNETHSSMSSKKSQHDQEGFSFEVNNNKKYKEVQVKKAVQQVQQVQQEDKAVNSRTKLSDQSRVKHTSSSISDDQSELFVGKKSTPVSEVLEQKPASRGTVESHYKSAEKNAYESYMSRSSELEKDVIVNATSTSCLASPQKEYQSNTQSKIYNEVRDSGLQSSQKHMLAESQRMETFNVTSSQQWDSPSKVSETSNSYVTRTSGMIEKFPSAVPYEGKVSSSYSAIANYTVPNKSPVDVASISPVSSYTSEATKTSYDHHHQIQVTTAAPPTVTNIMGGIDTEVKKIMDKIFIQNNTIPSLNLPLNPSTDSDTTRANSHFLSSPEIYAKPSDRSPTFAHSSPETQGFNYKQYSASYLDHKEKTAGDHLTTDWNLRIFPSMESSLTGSDVKKICEFPQATASFGLIPSAPSEESLTSKMMFAGLTNRQSQASNTFLEVDSYTRDRAVSGKFGGSSECTTNLVVVPETLKEECHSVEPIHKTYNFTGNNQISTSYEDIDTMNYLKAKTPINKKIEHSKEVNYDYLGKVEHYSPTSHHDYSHVDYSKNSEHKPHEEHVLKTATSLYTYPVSHHAADYSHIDYTKTYEHIDKPHEEHHLKSAAAGIYTPPIYESPSGRASITDTWSVPTMPKILDVGVGSLDKSAEMTTSEMLQKYGQHVDINAKRSSLYEATSDFLDIGSISNRGSFLTKEITTNKYQEAPVSSVPMYSYQYPVDKEISTGKLEEDLSKIIMLKLELLVREQSKATEAMEEVKKSLNEKLEALFREEKRESETFKILLNHKLDSLFKEKTLDLSKEQLAQIHQELTGNQKQVNASFSGVNKKLDLLLLKQGRLNVETEENLVNKLETMMTKHTRHESLHFASQNTRQVEHKESIGVKSEDPRRSLKNCEATENVRSEIFIADSSAEYNTANKRKSHATPVAETKVSKNDISDHVKNSQVNNVTSNKEHRKDSSSVKQSTSNTNVLIKDFAQNTELSKSHHLVRKQVENDVCNISDDAIDYASVASDSAPLKIINSMQPKSKELSIKNEHTINLLQYESELRNLKSQEKQFRASHKSDKEVISTPNNKGINRSLTPQSKDHTELSHRNCERSPRPITSQNSSMIIDTQPPTHRQSKGEIYTSGKSPVSNQRENLQVSFKGNESSSSEKHKSVYKFPVSHTKDKDHTISPNKESAHWHMVPLCAQDSLLDEAEEVIREERLNSDLPSEERKTQALPSPGNFTNRSHASKGQKSELKKNSLGLSHNRANSISSQSSYNVFDLKSQRLSVTKGASSKDFHERVPHNTAQSVFDNFVVTSNNNDIPPAAAGEYVRVEKNSAVHRNMAFMASNGPKIMSSAKKHSQKEVDLYEEEARNKRKTSHWRNEEELYDGCSTGRNQAYMGSRSSHKGNKTVYQEGRLGTVRWRFEIEDLATEGESNQMCSKNQYESERRDEYDSAEMREYYGNLAFDKKIKSISAMNSPITQRRELDHLMRTVNISKDVGTYENNMYSPCKNRPEDVMSSSRTGHNVKIPSLRLGHETQEKTYFVPNGNAGKTKKHAPYGYGNLTISHVDHDMK